MSLPAYGAYKDSGVAWLGEVPGHWDTWKLAQAFEVIGSGTTPKSDAREYYDDGDVPWVNTGDLNDGDLWAAEKCVTAGAVAAHSSLKVYPAGGVVIAMYGATIGRLSLVHIACTVNQACCVFGRSAVMTARFTFYSLLNAREQILSLATGGGQPNVSQEVLRSLRLAVPPLPEQLAIATFLDRETARIDALIAEQEKLIALLKEKRQAVISHAVTKGLDAGVAMKDSGVEWLGEVPGHWEVRRVKSVSSFLTSGPRGWSERVGTEGAIFVQSGDLDDAMNVDFARAKRVIAEGDAEASRTLLRAGDVVVCITGAKTGNVAACPTVPEAAYVNQHLCLIRPTNEIRSSYLALLLKGDLGQRHFEVSQYGLKQGLSLEDVKNAPVVVPPLKEQDAVLAHWQTASSHLDTLTTEATRAIALLQERRTALISAAVTGKIDVRGVVDVVSATHEAA